MRQRAVASVVAGIFVPGGGQLVAGRETRAIVVWLAVIGMVVAGVFFGAAGNQRGFYAMIGLAVLGNFGAVVNAALTPRGTLRSAGVTLALVAIALTASGGVQLVLRRSVLEMFSIPSGSMAPTLRMGDHIAVDKRARTPARGDVVVYTHGDKDFVKRVIAIGGDRIEFRDDAPFVNGLPVPEVAQRDEVMDVSADGSGGLVVPAHVLKETLGDHSYEIMRTGATTRAVPESQLQADEIFVVGDNRDNSHDSRFTGPVKLADVKGIVRFVWMGLTKDRTGVEVR